MGHPVQARPPGGSPPSPSAVTRVCSFQAPSLNLQGSRPRLGPELPSAIASSSCLWGCRWPTPEVRGARRRAGLDSGTVRVRGVGREQLRGAPLVPRARLGLGLGSVWGPQGDPCGLALRWELFSKSKQKPCPGGGPPGASDSCRVALRSSKPLRACGNTCSALDGGRGGHGAACGSPLGPGRFPCGANTLPQPAAGSPCSPRREEVSTGTAGGRVPNAGPGWAEGQRCGQQWGRGGLGRKRVVSGSAVTGFCRGSALSPEVAGHGGFLGLAWQRCRNQ